jgi:uncharacterized lipoprotein YddW (UPF0748 family)
MNKREFLRRVGIGGLGLVAHTLRTNWGSPATGKTLPGKHWAWVATDLQSTTDAWKRRFADLRRAGITQILPEVYNSRRATYGSKHLPAGRLWLEELLPLATAEGLDTHAWIWALPCNIEEVGKEHPEWFTVNRNGESSLEKPAYVKYYRFLCPSHPEVHEFLKATLLELCSIDELTGVHLDYIRYPDVILPEALQPGYGLTQDREYAAFDYCYCELCRSDFKRKAGIDPILLDDPPGNRVWRQFRYDIITRLVNDTLVPVAHARKKIITAAVFPRWENVRQEWPLWNVDGLLPMLYHSLYKKDTEWIKEETGNGVRSVRGRVPLYSGIMVSPRLPLDEFAQALEAALEGGASGIALFHAAELSRDHLETFHRVTDPG